MAPPHRRGRPRTPPPLRHSVARLIDTLRHKPGVGRSLPTEDADGVVAGTGPWRHRQLWPACRRRRARGRAARASSCSSPGRDQPRGISVGPGPEPAARTRRPFRRERRRRRVPWGRGGCLPRRRTDRRQREHPAEGHPPRRGWHARAWCPPLDRAGRRVREARRRASIARGAWRQDGFWRRYGRATTRWRISCSASAPIWIGR